MDLSHLVSIGLFPAVREPLKADALDYLRQHKVDSKLAEIIEQLAKQKPADPYKFIIEACGGAAGASGAKPAAAAAPAPKPAAKEVKVVAVAAKAAAAPAAAAPAAGGGDVDAAIKAKGDAIRAAKDKLKASGLKGKDVDNHDEVKQLVAELGELKASGGATAAPSGRPPKEEKPKGDDAPKGDAPKKEKGEKPKAKAKAETALAKPSKGGGLDVRKAEDVPGWYDQVITKAELIQAYPVKGCFTLRPWAYRIWELIQRWFDTEIKLLGVENCYFPMFIPKCYLQKEEAHLDDFAAEVAWVTKFGNEDLEEPVAIRPTSETAMYAAYSDWVQSYRDLPIKLNQWCSVVRWEVKQTTPFLRTREFLWQEGHTAFADKASADKEVLEILELYAAVYEKLLAVPVVRGTKTKAETFPGADYTTTVEAFIPVTGRAIQGATSHHLGQNFSKMFDISFQDPQDPTKRANAWQNSWGITQRTLGVMIMVHGDDKGLILPPPIACFQVVLVPVGINAKSTEDDRKQLADKCASYLRIMTDAGIRVKLDDRDQTPGWKFNHWELKGVPLRMELGPMDLAKGEFIMARRHIADPKESKITGKDATMVADVNSALGSIHKDLYDRALAERDACLVKIDDWKDFVPNLNKGKMLLVPFCGQPECEENIKETSKEESAAEESVGGLKMGAKSLCVPHEVLYCQPCPPKCIHPKCTFSGVKGRTLFGRSY